VSSIAIPTFIQKSSRFIGDYPLSFVDVGVKFGRRNKIPRKNNSFFLKSVLTLIRVRHAGRCVLDCKTLDSPQQSGLVELAISMAEIARHVGVTTSSSWIVNRKKFPLEIACWLEAENEDLCLKYCIIG
jgi:hypothetical protein